MLRALVMDLEAISVTSRWSSRKWKDFLRGKYFCFNYARCRKKRASGKFPFSPSTAPAFLSLAEESIEHACTKPIYSPPTPAKNKLREGTIKSPREQSFDAVTCARQMFTNASLLSAPFETITKEEEEAMIRPIMTTIIIIIFSYFKWL